MAASNNVNPSEKTSALKKFSLTSKILVFLIGGINSGEINPILFLSLV